MSPRHSAGRWFEITSKATSGTGIPGADGGRQSLIEITDVRARERFVFDVALPARTRLAVVGDGLVARHRDGRVVAALTPPWAKDAHGVEVATRFELIDHDSFAQVVDHRVTAAYPVVADPFWVIPVLTTAGRILARQVVRASSRAAAMTSAKRAVSRAMSYSIDDLIARNGSQLISPFTGRNFRENVRRRTGWMKQSIVGYQAHHTLPQKFDQFWDEAGLNHHHPIFGHWWCAKDHNKQAYAFNQDWQKFINRFDSTVNNSSAFRQKVESKRIKVVSRFADGYQCPRGRIAARTAPGEVDWLGVAPSGRNRF